MNEIDYKSWLNLGGWTIEEAALLLTGHDPDKKPKPRLVKNVLPEFQKTVKLIRALKRNELVNTYGETQPWKLVLAAYGHVEFDAVFQERFDHLLSQLYLHFAQGDEWAKSWFDDNGPKYYTLAKKCFLKNGNADYSDGRGAHNKEKELENTLKLLGVVSRMLLEGKGKGKNVELNGRLNMEQYTKLIFEYMDFSGVDGVGLSKGSIKNKLTKAENLVKANISDG